MKMHDANDHKNFEEKRTFQILYFFGIVSAITLFSMSLINYLENQYIFFFTTLIFGLLVIYSMIHLYFKRRKNFTIFTYGFLALLLTFNLVTTGGVEGNGFLWIFIFPPLIYFLQGIKQGSITIVSMFFLIIVYFYIPDMPFKEYEYPDQFKKRFLIALLAESSIAFFAEYSRQKLLKEICDLSNTFKMLSKTDELTRIFNRRHGQEFLEYAHKLSARTGSPFSVIMFDIDHFKSVNDTYGHDVGDAILREIANRVRSCIRTHDILCRWGGEEFLIILPQTNAQQLPAIGEKLRALIADVPFLRDSHGLAVTCSFGCAQHAQGESLDDLTRRTDQCLYEAKAAGRNRLHISEPTASSPATTRPANTPPPLQPSSDSVGTDSHAEHALRSSCSRIRTNQSRNSPTRIVVPYQTRNRFRRNAELHGRTKPLRTAKPFRQAGNAKGPEFLPAPVQASSKGQWRGCARRAVAAT